MEMTNIDAQNLLARAASNLKDAHDIAVNYKYMSLQERELLYLALADIALGIKYVVEQIEK